jgi:hypothetical protein
MGMLFATYVFLGYWDDAIAVEEQFYKAAKEKRQQLCCCNMVWHLCAA